MIEQHFGQHTVRFEQPALFFFRAQGDFSPSEMKGVAAFIHEHAVGLPHLFVLCDARGLGDISAESRKAAISVSKGLPYRGIATFGASFHARMVAKLLVGAAQLLFGSSDNPVRFFDTEAEARAWLRERTRQLAAEEPIAAE
jgi:hypothetical protein